MRLQKLTVSFSVSILKIVFCKLETGNEAAKTNVIVTIVAGGLTLSGGRLTVHVIG